MKSTVKKSTKPQAKPRPGRPSRNVTKKAYSIRLYDDTEQALRDIGDGDRTRGIEILVQERTGIKAPYTYRAS